MLSKNQINSVIPILKEAAQRALTMKVRGYPKPFFCSFLMRDQEWFNTWASSGSSFRKRSDHTRDVYCDLRVGSYRDDQTTQGGLNDNDEELDSFQQIRLPIDDTCFNGMKLSLWRLSESKFREALSEHSQKQAQRLSHVDQHKKLASFQKLPKVEAIRFAKRSEIDEAFWVKFCKDASRWLSKLDHVDQSFVEFDVTQESKVYVSTEGRIIVQHSQVHSLVASIRKLTSEGLTIEQELVCNTALLSEQLTLAEFKKRMKKKHEQLLKLIKARKIHSFSGPVLLGSIPSGLLFHEAIGHRLEGSRLLSSGEGQTFKGQIGKPVVNVKLSIKDDPTLKKFGGLHCIGAYEFDDEGTPAGCAELVSEGHLRGFLNTRAELPAKGNQMNGHARCRQHQRPISRMGVTIVKGEETVSSEQLKELLVAEIKRQGKPFGMIVHDTSGGETDTTSYDFQAFAGQISFATLVYPDGKEEVVRGVDFVGTPLQALQNIVAVGDDQVIDNHFCGAESGFLPVTTISPSILIKNLELQAKDETLITQFLLPRPKLS
jgi:TldD protein